MAHIALIITGLSGKLHASFEIASRLESESHHITYLCSLNVREKVERNGFSYMQLPEVNFAFDHPENTGFPSSWRKRFTYHFKNYSTHYENGKRLLKLEEYKQVLRDLSPDRVLVDMEMHDLIFSAIALKIPVTLFTTWFSDKISTNLPPIRSNIIPGKGFYGTKLGIGITWIYFRSRFWARLLLNKLTFKNYRRSVLKNYAKEIGFQTKHLFPSSFPPLFTYKNLPILSMSMRELEFPHRPADNWIYMGPMVYERRDEKDADSLHDQGIYRIFELQRTQNKKLIYCSVSTFEKGDVVFLQNVIKAVAKNPNWLLIVSLGGKLSIEDFTEPTDNVFVFDWVPQMTILKQSDCSINHGGINSINECIHFSIPMVVYSGKGSDQNGCAARIAYHGLGLRGDKDKDDIETIYNKIQQVLKEDIFREKMVKINSQYKEYRKIKLSPFVLDQFK